MQPPADGAVVARDLSKSFRLPREQVHTLKERVLHPMRRRSFDRLQALHDVSFEVHPGEFFGVVGRNGSGKTTLMKCIAGIYRPDAGAIWLRGRLAPFIELGVGFNPDLAARDNVLINAIMLGLNPAEARARYDDIIRFAELEQFADLKLKNYSSGMQVRLAFAVMAHVDADVLLIDEVLAVGDVAFQQKCHDALNAARDRGRTILLVTHDMNAVQRFCDRAMLLERGAIVAIGDPRRVARAYNDVNFQHGERIAGALAARVGDGAAAILESWFAGPDGVRADVVPHGERCGMAMRVEFRTDVTDPAFGFVVTDAQHKMVFAASSDWTRPRSGSFRAGESVEVMIGFDNVLAGGRYYLSPQVAYAGPGERLMDLRENAASALVVGGREGAGVVDVPYDVDIVRAASPVQEPAAP